MNFKFQILNFKLTIKQRKDPVLLDIGNPPARLAAKRAGRQGWIFDIGHLKFPPGFTMVELLAVIIVLVALGSMIGGIFFATLRGANKSNALTTVRQNGDTALLQMTKTLRNAKSFSGVSTDGGSYTTDCTVVSANPTPTPVPYKYVQIESFDGGAVTYSCQSTYVASNGASLIDTTAVELVQNSCQIACTQSSAADIPTIGIRFTLKQKTTSTFPENQVQLPFQTSVSLRNGTE